VFPDLRIDITGWGTQVVERVVSVPGAANTLSEQVPLRLLYVSITSREPDRNSVLSFTLRYRGASGDLHDEVIWPPPHWKVALESGDVLRGPIGVSRENTIGGILAFAPSQFPVDESDRGRLQVFDYISRTRVRFPTDMGSYSRSNWEWIDHRRVLPAWWRRIIEREERLAQR
jgi:hypothetical protein